MLAKLKPHRFALLLAPAVLSLFWPALVDPFRIPVPTFSPFSDILVIHWPKAHLLAQSWQAGEGLPLWNPLILSGMPLAANQLAMLFYPPAWLFLALPPEPVFNLLFIFHLLLGGFGVYIWLRRGFGLEAGPALLGGLTFALNGKWLAHVAAGHVSMVGAIGWLPWAVLGWQMVLNRLKEADGIRAAAGWALLSAVALAMQAVTHTLLLLYTVYLLAAMLGWRVIATLRRQTDSPGWAVAGRAAAVFAAIVAVAGLLAAVQLLPLLELTPFSNRNLSPAQAAGFAVTPTQLLVGLLLPSARAGHELVIYAGLVPLLLAPFGLARRNGRAWFWAGVFLFSVLFALGPATPLHGLVYTFVPGFRWVRTPARMFFVAGLALAALVGFGAGRLARHTWPPAAQRWLSRLGVAVAALGLLLGVGLAAGFGQTGRPAVALALVVPAGTGLVLLKIRQKLSAWLTITLLGLLLFLDLASFDLSLVRFAGRAETFAPGRAATNYLAQQQKTSGPFRVYSPSYSLPAQTAAAAGLHLADGVEPVHLAVYDRYMAAAGGYNNPGFSVTIPNFGDAAIATALKNTQPNLKLLGLLNVTYLAAAYPMEWPGLTLEQKLDGVFIYRNAEARPRAWVARQAIPAGADWLAQLQNLPADGDTVLVEAASLPAPRPAGAFRPRVQITRYTPNVIELETGLDEPGWLILSEIWYPGWQARVNGRPQPVQRVNGLLRGVELKEPGAYHIRLVYRPKSVVWGGWISGLSVAGLAATGGLVRRAKRRS